MYDLPIGFPINNMISLSQKTTKKRSITKPLSERTSWDTTEIAQHHFNSKTVYKKVRTSSHVITRNINIQITKPLSERTLWDTTEIAQHQFNSKTVYKKERMSSHVITRNTNITRLRANTSRRIKWSSGWYQWPSLSLQSPTISYDDYRVCLHPVHGNVAKPKQISLSLPASKPSNIVYWSRYLNFYRAHPLWAINSRRCQWPTPQTRNTPWFVLQFVLGICPGITHC